MSTSNLKKNYHCNYCYQSFGKRKEVHRAGILEHIFLVDGDYVTEMIQCYKCNTCTKKDKVSQKLIDKALAKRTQKQIDYDEGMQKSANR